MATCPHCNQEFPEDIHFCPNDGTPLQPSKAHKALEGTVLAGRYRIVRELGHGGMGVVYLATHVRMDRPVALKILRTDIFLDADAVSRFHREARSASQISHPNVVAVYDSGETEDGLAYLAMEYVDGRPLETVLKEVGALSPRRTARIVWQIANGLNAAHDLKIVHRDLKPNNLMLTRYRSWDDFVKIVDFGIAKAFGGNTTSDVTSAGFAIGTPEYMSPEQWAAGDTDNRSDIFSLGLIAVRMMAGGLPVRRSLGPITGRRVLDALPTAADWPEKVKAVLVKALEIVPEDRYATAAEFGTVFAEAVTEWVPPVDGVREPWEDRLSSGLPVPAATVSIEAPRKRWVRRALFAGLGIVVATGALALANRGRSRPRADSVAVAHESTVVVSKTPDVGGRPTDSGTARRRKTPVVGPPPKTDTASGSGVGHSVQDSIDFVLRGLDESTPVPDSARRVVAWATSLLRRNLADTTRIDLTYRLAVAKFFLEEDEDACALLRGVLLRAISAGFLAPSIGTLLDRHCQ